MDYVETVLQRQYALWAALFNGSTEEQEKQKPRPLLLPDERKVTGDTEWTGKLAYRGMWDSEADNGREAKSDEEMWGAGMAAGHALAAALEARGRGIRETLAVEEQAVERGFTADEVYSRRRLAGRAAESGAEQRLMETREEGRGPEADGLRVFSLTLERDTRRFDGGFALY